MAKRILVVFCAFAMLAGFQPAYGDDHETTNSYLVTGEYIDPGAMMPPRGA